MEDEKPYREQRLREIGHHDHAYGPGLPLMLVIFVILCLVTLAVLSLFTAGQSKSQREQEYGKLWNRTEAENSAEEWVRKETEKSLVMTDLPLTEEKTFLIDNGNTLSVRLERGTEGEPYRITRWKTVTEAKETEQSLKGITGVEEK